MLGEAKVEVRYGLRVEKVEKDGARIRRITLSDGSTVSAKVFVDAGYEGDLMARAGVGYTWGRESREEFGEEAAGIRFDKTPRKAATVDEPAKLLPGMKRLGARFSRTRRGQDGDELQLAPVLFHDPAWRVPIPEPQHYDRARYRLLENWLREKTAASQAVKLDDIIDLYSTRPIAPTKRRSTTSRPRSSRSAISARSASYPDADYATREKIIAEHTDYTLGLFHFLATDESVPEKTARGDRAMGAAQGGICRQRKLALPALCARSAGACAARTW